MNKKAKVIELFPEEEVKPIPYNRRLDENDYALWKARQNSKNIIVLKGGEK